MPPVSDAPYWLALLSAGPLKRQVAKQVIRRWCVEGDRTLASLFEEDAQDLRSYLALSAQQMAGLLSAREQVAQQVALLAEWSRQGVGLVTRCDAAYPESWVERLPEERLPYCLFYRGALELLAEPAFALLGGVQASPEALDVAGQLGRMFALEGQHLLGGYDRGIGRVSLDAALAAGGRVTLLLPSGLAQLSPIPQALDKALRNGQALLLSPYLPDVPCSEALAEARLPLICALSEGLLLIAPDRTPNEWAYGTEGLPADRRTWFWSGADALCTRAWLEAGATPFRDVAEMRAQMLELLGVVPEDGPVPSGKADDSEPMSIPRDQAPQYERQIPYSDTDELSSFTDAESAIKVLGRQGTVPEVLARRLRETHGGRVRQ